MQLILPMGSILIPLLISSDSVRPRNKSSLNRFEQSFVLVDYTTVRPYSSSDWLTLLLLNTDVMKYLTYVDPRMFEFRAHVPCWIIPPGLSLSFGFVPAPRFHNYELARFHSIRPFLVVNWKNACSEIGYNKVKESSIFLFTVSSSIPESLCSRNNLPNYCSDTD